MHGVFRHALRVCCLVLFSLLTSAATASAECAWVLWVVHQDQKPVSRPFDIAATYPKLNECVAKLDETERGFAPGATILRDAPTVLHVLFRKQDGSHTGTGFSWLCAPDTVDPRGPKGK